MRDLLTALGTAIRDIEKIGKALERVGVSPDEAICPGSSINALHIEQYTQRLVNLGRRTHKFKLLWLIESSGTNNESYRVACTFLVNARTVAHVQHLASLETWDAVYATRNWPEIAPIVTRYPEGDLPENPALELISDIGRFFIKS